LNAFPTFPTFPTFAFAEPRITQMLPRFTHTALFVMSLATIPVAHAQAPAADDTSWVSRSALYEVFVQDFSPSGTFRGVIDGLDRIQSAGANVIWLMPIYPIGVLNRKGPLGSPYAVRDYRAVNPAYGTAADFRALVEAVHSRGMKIILDFVPNHTSPDNAWAKEHPDFYVRNKRGELTVPRDDKGNLTDWTDVAQLDYKNPKLRQAMIANMQYWLREFGIDGFRVDVAGFIPNDFWREAVPALRSAVPRRILLLAEWGDLEMHRSGFDLTYAWDSYDRLKAVWQGKSASTFVEGELPDMKAMPPGGMRMRFSTNHDKTAWEDPPLKVFRGSPGARAAFVALALLPGRPLLYNGQEIESPQKLGLFEDQAIDWKRSGADSARAFYARVVNLARTEPALIGRDFQPAKTSAPKDVIAYRRGDLLVLVNARPRPVKVAVNGFDVAGARDLLSNNTQRGDTTLPAYGAVVLKP
jgi:glycosidase